MANLLPPFARKKLVREYWVRVATLVLFMLSVVMVAQIIMLLPTYVTMSQQVTAIEETFADAEAEQVRTDEAMAELQVANRLVRYLHEGGGVSTFTHYYNELQTVSGQGVFLTEFSIQTTDGVTDAISVRAVATTRQVLIDFLDDLQRHPEFGRVDVPIENLAQSENIEFSVRVPILSLEDRND